MKDEAEKFIEFLVNEQGQQVLADSYALEFPLNPAVQLGPPVKQFSELRAAARSTSPSSMPRPSSTC